jgi:hypothetical protein
MWANGSGVCVCVGGGGITSDLRVCEAMVGERERERSAWAWSVEGNRVGEGASSNMLGSSEKKKALFYTIVSQLFF